VSPRFGTYSHTRPFLGTGQENRNYGGTGQPDNGQGAGGYGGTGVERRSASLRGKIMLVRTALTVYHTDDTLTIELTTSLSNAHNFNFNYDRYKDAQTFLSTRSKVHLSHMDVTYRR
jgi:hypothetical protein